MRGVPWGNPAGAALVEGAAPVPGAASPGADPVARVPPVAANPPVIGNVPPVVSNMVHRISFKSEADGDVGGLNVQPVNQRSNNKAGTTRKFEVILVP